MKISKLILFFFLLSVTIFTACDNDDDIGPEVFGSDVIVINEGNFLSSDGSLSTFSTTMQEHKLSQYVAANGFPIAASIQTGNEHDGRYYFVTTLADKVEIVNKTSFKSESVIQPGSADLFMLANPFDFASANGKGYISNWGKFNSTTFVYENSFIAIVDLATNDLIKKIDVDVQPQSLLATNDKIFVADVGGTTVSVIDPATDMVANKITVPFGPDAMVQDRNGKIWVLCRSGNLVRINPETEAVEQTIDNVQASGFNEKMAINGEGDKMIYLSSAGFAPSTGEIYEISIDATSVPSQPIVTAENIYGIGVHPTTGVIFAADNAGFAGNGTVYMYDAQGIEMGDFPAGRGPNGFLFR